VLELLINQEKDIKTIMLIENGILVEKHEEHKDEKRLEGNIYLGRVENVLSGMQSAFIDVGIGRNSLIKLKDIMPKIDEAKEQYFEEKDISDVLKKNDIKLVQIRKDGTEKKGSKISTHVKLPRKIYNFNARLRNNNSFTKNWRWKW